MILGLSTMELTALKETYAAHYYSLAVIQLNGMHERLYALDHYSGLQNEVNIWNKENQIVLPNGKGEVEGHYPSYTIKLCWGNSECLQEPDLKKS